MIEVPHTHKVTDTPGPWWTIWADVVYVCCEHNHIMRVRDQTGGININADGETAVMRCVTVGCPLNAKLRLLGWREAHGVTV